MIDLKNITAGYPGKEILHGITVSFEKGKLTSIIGPNGCGKSTLLKTALGIIKSSDGDVTVDDVSISGLKRKEIALRIAYLSQGKAVPDMTVGQMVLHGRFPHLSYPRRYGRRDREIADEAMARMGISELADEPMSSLSGGMRQNAYIAMALAQNTEYIILDEPTTYLDISHQLRLMKILHGLAEGGKGIIAVMHDLPVAFTFSDTVTVMQDGIIAKVGTPREIADSDIIKGIFGVRLHREVDEYFYRLSSMSSTDL